MTFLELEKKCKKRRLLRVIKILGFSFALLAGGYFGYNFLFKNKDTKKIDSINSIKEEKIKKENIPENKEITYNKEKVKEKNVLENKEVENSKEVPTLKLFLDFNTNDKNMDEKSIKEDKKNDNENTAKSFIKTSPLPSFKTCIFLAKKYYKEGNYREALKWVKNANIQDNKKAISWILTAKILNKMGKKEEAIKLLKLYYNYNKNEEVKKLMEQLNE